MVVRWRVGDDGGKDFVSASSGAAAAGICFKFLGEAALADIHTLTASQIVNYSPSAGSSSLNC